MNEIFTDKQGRQYTLGPEEEYDPTNSDHNNSDLYVRGSNDVFQHTKLTLENLEPRISTHAWACLLHDIGKVSTTEFGNDGRIHANQHHKVGADLTREVLTRLKFSSDQTDLITKVVYDHMKPMHIKDMKRSKLRRFLGSDHITAVLAVHKADCLASNGDLNNFEFAEEALASFEHEPILPDPLINGRHLIALDLQPGPIFKELLHEIQTMQLDGEISTEEEALKAVKVLLSRKE